VTCADSGNGKVSHNLNQLNSRVNRSYNTCKKRHGKMACDMVVMACDMVVMACDMLDRWTNAECYYYLYRYVVCS